MNAVYESVVQQAAVLEMHYISEVAAVVHTAFVVDDTVLKDGDVSSG